MQHKLFAAVSSGSKKQLRDYQEECVQAVFDYFSQHTGSPIIVIPTAGGKSLCIAELIHRANSMYPGTRFVVLSHVGLLLTQNAEELSRHSPDTHITFFSDGLGQKDLSGDVVFATIQSIYKNAYDFRDAPDLILVDEAHLISPDSNSMYRRFFDEIRVINPLIKIVGFTATPYRAGYGMLHEGKNALFTHIAYEVKITDLINRGYLSPIITPDGGVMTKMDTTGVRMNGGDFVQSQLAKKVDDEALTKSCVDEIIFHGQDRKKWIVFCVDINHCEHVYNEIKSRGVECEMVHSKLDGGACARALDRFRDGNAKCLINVAMLTTGANFPAIDLIAFMRPTRSPVLYVQMAGRAMRIFPGKHNALLLDFGGVVEELGPIDAIRVKKPGEGTGEAPVKACPGIVEDEKICGAILPAPTMTCPTCGYIFPDPGLNLEGTASDAPVLSSQMKPKCVQVGHVKYYRHQKEGKPDCMRIEYLCGVQTYREWWHFSHYGSARESACAKWKERAGTIAPRNTDEALQRSGELKIPTHIYVKKIGKYHEIVGIDFIEDEEIPF